MFMWTVATHLLDSRFFGDFSRVTTGDSLSAHWRVLWKFCSVKRSDSPLLPNGRFADSSYDWSIMSSIVGPSLGSDLPRTTLPMEVVTASRYRDLVELSQTILLSVILSTADDVSRSLPIWLCGLWHSCMGHGVDETSGQNGRLPYCQCSCGWKCQHGGSSW